MKKSKSNIRLDRNRLILLVLAILLYISGYFVIRTEKLLIHRVSFRTKSNSEKVYHHRIIGGDFGVPMLRGSAPWIITDVAYYLYWPLRLAEVVLWKVYPRDYDV